MRSFAELLPRVLLRAGLDARFCFEICIRTNGRPVQIPFLGRLGYEYLDFHEPWMLETLDRLLKFRTGTFLDVGANVGQTLIKVKALDPERVYVGIEPNPVCVCYLEMLIKANQFRRCDIIPAALSTERSILPLQIFDDSLTDASASVVGGFREGKVLRTRPVLTCTYAEIADALHLDNLGVIKIDVEGAEWEVIQSLENILLKARPPIVIEILPVYSSSNQARLTRQRAIEQKLRDLRYCLYRIGSNGRGEFTGIHLVKEIGIHGDLSLSNYVAAPEESQEGLCAAMQAT